MWSPASLTDTRSNIKVFDIRYNINGVDISSAIIVQFLVDRQRAVRSSQDLGLLIAQARRRRRLSQRQLAGEFGVTQAWLSRVERGHQKAWLGQVLRLAVYLGIELTAGSAATHEAIGESKKPPAGDYPDLNTLV